VEVLTDKRGKVLAKPLADDLYHCTVCSYTTHDHMSMLEHFRQHGIDVHEVVYPEAK
jgi:hypothetical protein